MNEVVKRLLEEEYLKTDRKITVTFENLTRHQRDAILKDIDRIVSKHSVSIRYENQGRER